MRLLPWVLSVCCIGVVDLCMCILDCYMVMGVLCHGVIVISLLLLP